MVLLFEVMDKELPLHFILGYFGLIAVAGFLLVRKHPAFLLLVVPLWLLYAPLHFSELNDPFVGPVIVREAGNSYVVLSYFAMAISAILPVVGFVAWVRRRMKSDAERKGSTNERAE
ncbi:MAG: hypothetical protein WBD16_04170 [Pyrinomonadaceae bacterium]